VFEGEGGGGGAAYRGMAVILPVPSSPRCKTKSQKYSISYEYMFPKLHILKGLSHQFETNLKSAVSQGLVLETWRWRLLIPFDTVKCEEL
jgi:hypothetical protein